MNLEYPYFRIYRGGSENYVYSEEYANNRVSSCRAYLLIVKDLEKILEYVEPCSANWHVYSHRIYELFLRTCTEFESNCKSILNSNGYIKKGDLNINDYYLINNSSRLTEYQVKVKNWNSNEKIILPFENWNSKNSLKWYKDYNEVKHNRENKFEKASLENLLYSITALLCILYSQYGIGVFFIYGNYGPSYEEDGFIGVITSFLSVKEIENWNPDETYKFDWDTIKSMKNPFRKFDFNNCL